MLSCFSRGAICKEDEDTSSSSHSPSSSRGAIPSPSLGRSSSHGAIPSPSPGRSSSRGAIGSEDEDIDSRISSAIYAFCVSRFNPAPVMLNMNDFARIQDYTNSYWVYAGFLESQHNFVALDIYEKTYVHLPNHMITVLRPATTVSDRKLYVIGGTTSGSHVYLFDPVLINWSHTLSCTIKTRVGAVAASINGKFYVFAGYERVLHDWGEMWDVSANTWMTTPIPASEVLNEANLADLYPLLRSVVLGKKIIVRGFGIGIAFDVMSNSWTQVSENLMRGWSDFSTAAVVQNMLITCHIEDEDGQHEISIRAYDPDQDVWLLLEGIDLIFHENAFKSKFTVVIIEIKEKLGTTVKANLLWQSTFPIRMITGPGNISMLQGMNMFSWPILLQPMKDESS